MVRLTLLPLVEVISATFPLLGIISHSNTGFVPGGGVKRPSSDTNPVARGNSNTLFGIAALFLMIRKLIGIKLVVNARVIVSVSPGVPVIVAGCPLILTFALVMPANVNSALAVSVTDAVYAVSASNGLWLGVHVTPPTVKLLEPITVAVVLGAAPVTGAVTLLTPTDVIGVGFTVKLFVVAVNSPNLTVTGLPWCVAIDNSVLFAGLVVILLEAKLELENATSLGGALS
jgi:hypothetical protein